MSVTTTTQAEAKREFRLVKRDGSEVYCKIPGQYTVGEAKRVLAERAGYEPEMAENSVRLAVEVDGIKSLVPDETCFDKVEEGVRLVPIPSLAPAC